MAEPLPNVRLDLASTPENVVLVREMLSGVAEATGLCSSDLNDIRTAVTEACNNVVLHAYEDERGPLEVELYIVEDTLTVVVCDRGSGIQGEPQSADTPLGGIGLHVIQTLSRHVECTHPTGGGTEVHMEFATPRIRVPEPPPEDDLRISPIALTGGSLSKTLVSIAPIDLARSVLPRVISALAARAHFSTDRISDAQMLADALVAQAHRAISGEHLSVGVNIEPRNLELQIAPLGVGLAQGLIGSSSVEGVGSVIGKLIDRHGIVSAEHYETLTLGLVDRR